MFEQSKTYFGKQKWAKYFELKAVSLTSSKQKYFTLKGPSSW